MSYNINYNIKGVSGQTLYSLPTSSGTTNGYALLSSGSTSYWGPSEPLFSAWFSGLTVADFYVDNITELDAAWSYFQTNNVSVRIWVTNTITFNANKIYEAPTVGKRCEIVGVGLMVFDLVNFTLTTTRVTYKNIQFKRSSGSLPYLYISSPPYCDLNDVIFSYPSGYGNTAITSYIPNIVLTGDNSAGKTASVFIDGVGHSSYAEANVNANGLLQPIIIKNESTGYGTTGNIYIDIKRVKPYLIFTGFTKVLLSATTDAPFKSSGDESWYHDPSQPEAGTSNISSRAVLDRSASFDIMYAKRLSTSSSPSYLLGLDSNNKIVQTSLFNEYYTSSQTNSLYVYRTGDTMTGTLILPYLTATTISATTIKTTNDILINTLTVGQGNSGSDDATALGILALSSTNLNASGNTAIGALALRVATTSSYNTAVGAFALTNVTIGQGHNVGIGVGALGVLISGSTNVAIGPYALSLNKYGNSNVVIGRNAMQLNYSGSSNIALGDFAGYYATGSSELFISNDNHGSYASSKTNSIIYVVMASLPSNQSLYLNANVYINNKYSLPTTTGTSGYVLTSKGDGTTVWSASTSTGGLTIQPFTTLTQVGNSLTWDLNTSTNATVTLSANITSFTITGYQNGISGVLKVVQNGTGGHTLSLPTSPVSEVANGGGSAILLTSTGNAVDILSFIYDGSKLYWNAGYNYN